MFLWNYSNKFITSHIKSVMATFSLLTVLWSNAASTQTIDRSAASVLIAFEISTSEAKEAAVRAGEEIEAYRRELVRVNSEKRSALRQVGLTEEEKRRLEADLAESEARSERLLQELSFRDLAFRAQLAVYREGLPDIISQEPEIKELLLRYADGDRSALDQTITILRLQAKAQRVSGGDRLRFAADLADDARRKGQKSAEDVLALRLEAVDYDPVGAKQWIAISELYSVMKDASSAESAAISGWANAADDFDRALVLLRYKTLNIREQAGLAPGYPRFANAVAYLQQAYLTSKSGNEQMRVLDKFNELLRNNLANWEVTGEKPSDENISLADYVLDVAKPLAINLVDINPENNLILYSLYELYRFDALLALLKNDQDSALAAFDSSAAYANRMSSHQILNSPKYFDVSLTRDVATAAALRKQFDEHFTLLQKNVESTLLDFENDKNGSEDSILIAHSAWSAANDVGFSGWRWRPDKAQEGFALAYKIGQTLEKRIPNHQWRFSYMASLTRHRLALSELQLGNVSAAERLFTEIAKEEELEAGSEEDRWKARSTYQTVAALKCWFSTIVNCQKAMRPFLKNPQLDGIDDRAAELAILQYSNAHLSVATRKLQDGDFEAVAKEIERQIALLDPLVEARPNSFLLKEHVVNLQAQLALIYDEPARWDAPMAFWKEMRSRVDASAEEKHGYEASLLIAGDVQKSSGTLGKHAGIRERWTVSLIHQYNAAQSIINNKDVGVKASLVTTGSLFFLSILDPENNPVADLSNYCSLLQANGLIDINNLDLSLVIAIFKAQSIFKENPDAIH